MDWLNTQQLFQTAAIIKSNSESNRSWQCIPSDQ